jgi:hypothetical protein
MQLLVRIWQNEPNFLYDFRASDTVIFLDGVSISMSKREVPFFTPTRSGDNIDPTLH